MFCCHPALQVHDCIVNRATSRARPAFPGQTIGGGVVDLEASFRCMMGDPVCPTEGLPPCVNGTSGEPRAVHLSLNAIKS